MQVEIEGTFVIWEDVDTDGFEDLNEAVHAHFKYTDDIYLVSLDRVKSMQKEAEEGKDNDEPTID